MQEERISSRTRRLVLSTTDRIEDLEVRLSELVRTVKRPSITIAFPESVYSLAQAEDITLDLSMEYLEGRLCPTLWAG